MKSNVLQPIAKFALVEAMEDTVVVVSTMDIEAKEVQVDIVKEEVVEARNAVQFLANPVKKSQNNHVIQYLAKFQSKTANRFQDNPANLFLANNVNPYHAKNADQYHLKNAKAYQLKYAVEEAALEVIEVVAQVVMEVEDAATRVEEDTAIMARKTLSSFTLPSRNISKRLSTTNFYAHKSTFYQTNFFASQPKIICDNLSIANKKL